jgi:uncharacterized protein
MEKRKKTLVLGASDNPSRYSYLAIDRLRKHGHPVVAIGKRKVIVGGVDVDISPQPFKNVDTVTMYLNPHHQEAYYDYIISLRPNRVIFNPGSENEELQSRLTENNIPFLEACTLVLLSTGQY